MQQMQLMPHNPHNTENRATNGKKHKSASHSSLSSLPVAFMFGMREELTKTEHELPCGERGGGVCVGGAGGGGA